MTAYFYTPATSKWYSTTITATFTLVAQTRQFLADSLTAGATKAEIMIWKDGTDDSSLNYKCYQ